MTKRIEQNIGVPESDLALAYFLGESDILTDELSENIRRAGLSHMVAVSGFHLAIIIGAASRVGKKISRFASLWLSLIIMLIFSALVGFGASITRACLVSGMNMWASYYGRKIHKIRLIIYALALSLIISPMRFLELGWQLSFLAYFGIVIVSPIIERYFYGKSGASAVGSALIQSLSAQLLCLPVTIYNFGSVSVVGIFASLIISPTMAPLFALIFGSLFSWTLGRVASLGLRAHEAIITRLADISWAAFSLQKKDGRVFLAYAPLALLLGIIWLKVRPRRLDKTEKYGKIYSC